MKKRFRGRGFGPPSPAIEITVAPSTLNFMSVDPRREFREQFC